MLIPWRRSRLIVACLAASCVIAPLTVTPSPSSATTPNAVESHLPVYCLSPDGILGSLHPGGPSTRPDWYVGLQSDPRVDVSDFLPYREGRAYGIHPGGFGSMTDSGELEFDARGLSGSTTLESNTGDIRFLGVTFRNDRGLYAEGTQPEFSMYIGPSAELIERRCGGTFYDSTGTRQDVAEIYWTPAYRVAEPMEGMGNIAVPMMGTVGSS